MLFDAPTGRESAEYCALLCFELPPERLIICDRSSGPVHAISSHFLSQFSNLRNHARVCVPRAPRSSVCDSSSSRTSLVRAKACPWYHNTSLYHYGLLYSNVVVSAVKFGGRSPLQAPRKALQLCAHVTRGHEIGLEALFKRDAPQYACNLYYRAWRPSYGLGHHELVLCVLGHECGGLWCCIASRGVHTRQGHTMTCKTTLLAFRAFSGCSCVVC